MVVGGIRRGVVAVCFLFCATGAAQAGGVEGPGSGKVGVEGADEFEDALEEEEGGNGGSRGGLVAGELGGEVGMGDEGRDETNVSVWGDKSGGDVLGVVGGRDAGSYNAGERFEGLGVYRRGGGGVDC